MLFLEDIEFYWRLNIVEQKSDLKVKNYFVTDFSNSFNAESNEIESKAVALSFRPLNRLSKLGSQKTYFGGKRVSNFNKNSAENN